MRYRNMVTGAVIDSNSVISGANWQELTPAGCSFGKKPEVSEEKEPEKVVEETVEEEVAPVQQDKEEKKNPEKPAGGAVIKPRKGK